MKGIAVVKCRTCGWQVRIVLRGKNAQLRAKNKATKQGGKHQKKNPDHTVSVPK